MDRYAMDCATLLLDRLNACTGTWEGYEASDAPNAVLGQAFRTHSDYPEWYSALTTRPSGGSEFDGAKIRAALEAVASGRDPNIRQREARWLLDAIEGARASGDRALDLPSFDGRRDGKGGARRGVKQARSTVDGAASVRFPLRVKAATIAVLRERAAAAGMTLNAYLAAILENGASEALPAASEVPF